MAVPVIEIDALLKSLESIIRNTFFRLQNEFNQSVADGVSPKVAIQRIKDQISLDQGTVIQGANAMASQTNKTMRNVYHTLNQEWSTSFQAAKRNPQTFQFFSKVGKNLILPADAGYSVTLDDLGNKIVRFSGKSEPDELDVILEQKRKEREFRRLSEEQQSIQKGVSRDDKKNINLIWIAVFRNTCKDCIRLHGTMKTRLEWQKSGVYPGSGRTVCGSNCLCHLTPAQTVGSRLGVEGETQMGPREPRPITDNDIQKELKRRTENGIKIQKERIKKMAEKRGKQYSEEYEEQMIGEIQGPRFNPWAFSGKRTNLYLKTVPKNKVTKKFIENVQVRS